MNVRIFWVCAMKCMCAQTRPYLILSSKRVFWGMEFEPMLTPREKSPLLEDFPGGGSNLRRCGQRAQTLPTSYSGPLQSLNQSMWSTPWSNLRLTHVVCLCQALTKQGGGGNDVWAPSGMCLLYQVPHWGCTPNLLSHPVSEDRHPANQS